MAEPAVAIRVQSLEKRFADQVILKGISLSVAPGEVCGIIGP